ncbi:hypothetical protein ACFQU7_43250 [Pseudoroseomonas wenyumeiae]
MTAVLRGVWRLALTLLALPFALIGWLWICLRTAGSGALLGGLLGLLCNVVLLQPPDLRHGAIGLLLGGLVGWVLALLNLLGPVSFGRGTPATSHGSAAWAAPRQLRRDLAAAALARDPGRCWLAVRRVVVGRCCATLVPPICSPSPPPAPARASAPCCPTCC